MVGRDACQFAVGGIRAADVKADESGFTDEVVLSSESRVASRLP
jgi:hypothetical protein